MSKHKTIPLSVPSLKGNELKYVTECIETEWISSVGSFVNRFENEMAQKLGSPHAVACVNGTAALHISMILSGVQADDEVLVPTLTFIATANAVRYVDAYPVFLDSDDHLNLDHEKVADFLAKECEETSRGLKNKKTGRIVKAIVAVHIFGHPANLKRIRELTDRYQLKLIEDATESVGSYYRDWNGSSKYAGTVGDFACLSFNGNKLLSTGGGGMILTPRLETAQKARYLTTQAKDSEDYQHSEIGFNYRLTNIAAAIGCAQLEQLDEFIKIKRAHYQKYREALLDIEELVLLGEPEYAFSNFWLNAVILQSKEASKMKNLFISHLKEKGIEARAVWELCHRQKPYKNCQNYRIEKAFLYESSVVNLPSSVSLSNDDLLCVIDAVREFYGTN